MSSKRGGGQTNRGDGNKPSPKGKNIAYDVDQLNQAIQDVNLDPNEDGSWQVISKKKKNKSGNGNGNGNGAPSVQWAAHTAKPNTQRTGGRGNSQSQGSKQHTGSSNGGRGAATAYNYNHNYNEIPPPLQSGLNWNARPADAWKLGNGAGTGRRENVSEVVQEDYNNTGNFDLSDDADDDDDDDDDGDDEYNLDESPKTHEARKKDKWFAVLFENLDSLTVDQINEPTRQWDCPACQNGPGAIDWYHSLPSLVTHAKTIQSKRVKIHRILAEILEEELRTRGITAGPAGESFGQWKGLNEVVKDKEIVWPPMVVVMNTQLEQDENGKWLGMGNPELLDYFRSTEVGSYEIVKARHSYGPKGHQGMSVLIFESSAVGYTEAERLSKHFEHQGTDQNAWDHHPIRFYPGGKRQLYGYLATKEDLDVFNQHCQGKSKLKFELVSYQERVVNQLKQMNEDNQQLNWYKNKIVKEQKHSRALEESFGLVSQRLRKTEEENRIVRERTQRYHEQNKEEMDYQEQFFKDQLKVIQDARNAQEGHFDKQQKEERIAYSVADPEKRDENLEKMKEIEEEREQLMKKIEVEKAEMKRRHWKEEIEFEEGINARLTQLMEKYTPKDKVED